MVELILPNGENKAHLSPSRDMFVEGITSDRDVRDAQREQARRKASASDSEEESDDLVDDTTTISHISAHKSGSAWKYKVRDSLSGNWSYKEPKDIDMLHKYKMLMDARKTPGARVAVITGCGADDIAAKDDVAGGESGSSAAMEEAGASIHSVGPCPSSSAVVPLGSLNAEVTYHDKKAHCVSYSTANLMHAAGGPAAAADIAHRAPKGMLLKQLGAKINEKIKSWVARKPSAFGYDPENRDPRLERFVGWLLEQEEGLFVVALVDERKVADHAIGVDCSARRIYNPACTSTLPLTMDSLSECAPGGRKLIGTKEARRLVRL